MWPGRHVFHVERWDSLRETASVVVGDRLHLKPGQVRSGACQVLRYWKAPGRMMLVKPPFNLPIIHYLYPGRVLASL